MKPKLLVKQYHRKLTKVQKENSELTLRNHALELELKTLKNFLTKQQTHIQELVEKYEPD